MKASTFAAIGAVLARTCVGFELTLDAYPNLMARMDPIVSPGAVGNHVHSFGGTSNVREVLNTPEEQQRAGCVSVNVGADKSNYWSPALYYIHDNNTFSAMTPGTRIIYTINGKDVQPWPKGMRIVTGTATSKKKDTRNWTANFIYDFKGSDVLPNSQWPHETSATFAPLDIRVDFPSCGWANQSLDSGDHFSHLTWPIDTVHGNVVNTRGDSCPPSHPIKYPSMRLVNYYRFGKATPWRPGKDNVVFSNGDLDGKSFYAGFVSGWDENVLREAINTCGPVTKPASECAAFKPSFQPDVGSFPDKTVCPYQGKVPNEDIGLVYSIPQLPGCNPLWHASEETKPSCANHSPPPQWVAPNAFKGGSTQIYPLVLKEEHKGALFAKDPGFYGKPRFAHWGTVGRLNSSDLMMPANPPIDGWLPEDTNPTPFNVVKGMVDTSAWSGMLPGQAMASDTPSVDAPEDLEFYICGGKVVRRSRRRVQS